MAQAISMNLACATLEGLDYPRDLRPPLDYLIDDIVDFKFKMIDGKIQLPNDIGLGIKVDYEKLKKYTVAEYKI